MCYHVESSQCQTEDVWGKQDIFLLNMRLIEESAFYVSVKLKVVENKSQTVRGLGEK